jgi:hypothetical protein
VGLILLLAFGVVWIVTALQGRAQVELSLVGAALTLYGVGVLGRARALLDKVSPPGGPDDLNVTKEAAAGAHSEETP